MAGSVYSRLGCCNVLPSVYLGMLLAAGNRTPDNHCLNEYGFILLT